MIVKTKNNKYLKVDKITGILKFTKWKNMKKKFDLTLTKKFKLFKRKFQKNLKNNKYMNLKCHI